jgi:hypothetical protein
MARRVAALKPQLNRIRAWAHEGSTDAWIAHQLETTAESVRAFRQEHGIERGGPAPLAPITPDSVVEAMLAEEAAALEAGPEPSEPEIVSEPSEAPGDEAPAPAPRRSRARRPVVDDVEGPEVPGPAEEPALEEPVGEEPVAEEPSAVAVDAPAKPSRRRGARGGAGRKTAAEPEAAPVAEAEHDEAPAQAGEAETAPLDEEPGRSPRKRGRRRGRGRGGSRGLEARLLTGSVLLLDPSVASDPTFQEHWGDAGALRVEVSTDAIVLRRIAAEPEPDRSER